MDEWAGLESGWKEVRDEGWGWDGQTCVVTLCRFNLLLSRAASTVRTLSSTRRSVLPLDNYVDLTLSLQSGTPSLSKPLSQPQLPFPP